MFRIIEHACQLLLWLLLVSAPIITQAQGATPPVTDYPKRMISRFEFFLGANFIYARGSDHYKENRTSKFGFRGAIGLVHTFNTRWELGANFSYENKGYKTKVFSENPGPPPTDKLIEDLTLNYVTLTVLPRYTVMQNKKLEIGAGPYLGYVSTIRLTQELYFKDDLVSEYHTRINSNDTYKELDFGASFLIGSNFPLNESLGLTLQFIYSIGLMDVNQPVVGSLRNNTFSLLIGISLKKNSM